MLANSLLPQLTIVLQMDLCHSVLVAHAYEMAKEEIRSKTVLHKSGVETNVKNKALGDRKSQMLVHSRYRYLYCGDGAFAAESRCTSMMVGRRRLCQLKLFQTKACS
eukprot:750796_1